MARELARRPGSVGDMKPPIGYFGGKTRMAPWIASLMPEHKVYLEPFAGSAAVLFAKTPAKDEVLNDIDGDVVNFFRVLRDRADDLGRVCTLTPYARDEYALAFTERDVEDDLERARRFWIRSTQSFGQSAGADFGWSISLAQNVCRPHSVANRVGRFSAAADRLARCFIENMDALELIAKYDTADAVMYVDPPYLWSTRTSFNDAGSGARRRPRGDYAHEFNTDDDHRALAEVLHGARATVLLSGYASALYDGDLYADWHRVERVVPLHMSNGQSAKGRRPKRTEVLWSNRPFNDGRLDLTGSTPVGASVAVPTTANGPEGTR